MKSVFANVYPRNPGVVEAIIHKSKASADKGASADRVRVDELKVADDFVVESTFGLDITDYAEWIAKTGAVQVVPVLVADVVTVGDLNSSARGTGARKSSGKPDWSQIPWWVFPTIFRAWKDNKVREMSAGVYRVIELMGEWQRGKNESLDLAAAILLEVIYAPGGRPLNDKTSGDWFPGRGLASTADVLVFGAKKYAKGNWAKGMSWSVCFTCTMSHLLKSFQGEEKDEESGLNHLAHAMCNMLFLLGYRDLYPEGDDRLLEFRPAGVMVDLSHD